MKRTIGILAALAVAPAPALESAWASTDLPLSTQVSSAAGQRGDPVPPVKGRRNKDQLTLDSSDKHVEDHLAQGDPPKQHKSTTETSQTGDGKPTRPKRSKDQLPTDISDPADLRLRIGLCGRVQPDGSVPGPDWCQPVIPEERRTVRRVPRPPTPRPQDVTWEQVRSETRNVMFPGLSVKVQPTGRTLVNLDTIVYTDGSKMVTSTVTLLGFPVLVQATPLSYTWRFGDGSPELTTSSPGKPYPSKEITHKYMRRGGVSLTVTTNYAARFNVANTGWQYVDETIPVTGPATPLLVREAIPVLVDPGR
jgi:hypothetical protein